MVTIEGPPKSTWALTDAPSVLAFYRANVVELHRYLSKLTGGDRARTEDLVQEVFVALAATVRDGGLPCRRGDHRSCDDIGSRRSDFIVGAAG